MNIAKIIFLRYTAWFYYWFVFEVRPSYYKGRYVRPNEADYSFDVTKLILRVPS